MTLAKSLLLGTAAGFAAIAGAQAADLPSRKSAPVNYVKICDAYGAGFFFIPGTDTCLKVGGYVRVQYDYTPGRDVYGIATALAGAAQTIAPIATAGFPLGLGQSKSAQDTTGVEARGRVDLDARTPTALGTVRTFIRLRAANTSGVRNTNGANNYVNNAVTALSPGSATAISIESAFVQWAGFTFGVAPENYALVPGYMYGGMPYGGFPNGIKQLAYTATFGGGFSATLALEDRTDFSVATNNTYNHTPANGFHLVANVRVDQSWGFAALHGLIGNNSLRNDFAVPGAGFASSTLGGSFNNGAGSLASTGTATPLLGSATVGGYAIGVTAKINLPMLAAGDSLFLTANYTKGMLGAITGNNFNVQSVPAGHRFLGGIQRSDSGIVITSGNGTLASPYTLGSTTGWNVAALLTHYWAPQWRSNFAAGYIEINPPTVAISSATTNNGFQWGKGKFWTLAGSIIYSPAKDFDIGLELQYASMKNQIQNLTAANAAAFLAAGSPGLKDNSFALKMRIERQF